MPDLIMDVDLVDKFKPGKLSMSKEELLLYYSIIRMTGVRTVVECGTAFGVSTAWAAMALIDAKASGMVWTVDVEDRRGELVYERTEVESKIVTTIGNFYDYKVFQKIHRKISKHQPILVLLDGENGYSSYKKAWDSVAYRLKTKDWIMMHDTNTMKGANQLVYELGGKMFTFPGKHGLGVFKCVL